MGKNHRLKKKVKSEKAKTHLTSKTKFLPKGQNVTNTAFKIRPIVLQEQLKEKEANELLSNRRKLTINELITKLKHYNENIKSEACHELQLLFQDPSNKPQLQKHLAPIIQTSSALVQDRESKARRAAVKLLNEILHRVEIAKIVPFFTFISTNLRCAMTNISRNVQEDSLLLLDALLQHTPSLVAENADKIFPDFLTLISKLRSDSSIKRTLTLNLGSKMTSVNWRIKVLSRLHGILTAMIDFEADLLNVHQPKTNERTIADSCNSVALFKSCDVYDNQIDFLYAKSNLHYNFFGRHLETLIPLLYETWLEVMPEKSNVTGNKRERTVLTGESAAILSCTTNILCLLHKYVENVQQTDVFAGGDWLKFLNHLVGQFPYAQNPGKAANELVFSHLFQMKSDRKCVEENLLIVYLFFKSKSNGKQFKNNLTLVMNFLNDFLSKAQNVSEAHVEILLKILNQVLFGDQSNKWAVNRSELVENLIEFHGNNANDSLLDVLTRINLGQMVKNDCLQRFLVTLPNQLDLRAGKTHKLTEIVLDLCRKGNEHVQMGVKNNFKRILADLNDVKGKIDIRIFYIFYYVPNFDKGEEIGEAAKRCGLNEISPLFTV